MAQRIDNLNALDWDDSELIKAYDRGLSLREKAKKIKELSPKENCIRIYKRTYQWQVGDNCRAIYHGDGFFYEAFIISIHEDDDICTVEFVGYKEEATVKISSLERSHGKRAIMEQKEFAEEDLEENDIDESSSDDDSRNDHSGSESRHHHQRSHSRREYHRNSEIDHSHNYAAAENSFQNAYFVRHPDMSTMMPVAVPPCSEIQTPSMRAMLTAWYMAGYYAGLHQGQSASHQCCCRQTCNRQ